MNKWDLIIACISRDSVRLRSIFSILGLGWLCQQHLIINKTVTVIFGHSHRPLTHEKDGVSFMNPGSASYPKFGDAATVGLLRLIDQDFSPEFIYLTD